MNAHSATFYHYEPLLQFDNQQARSGPLAREAVRTLRDLMHCDYSSLAAYRETVAADVTGVGVRHNHRLWRHCEGGTDPGFELGSAYCWSETFLTRFCRLFPFQAIKTVRWVIETFVWSNQNPSTGILQSDWPRYLSARQFM